MERFARATAVAAALAAPFVPIAGARAADLPSSAASVGDAGSEVVFRALSLLGVNYRFGGNTPETGLDCSGLVRLVFSDALGLPLPRRSEEISRVGPAVAPTELQPGDLVFFNTLRRAFSHVGIYIGNNQFVHAPSTGGSIRVENLGADYWNRRFDGARRLLTQDLLAAATMNPLSASAARAMQASTAARTARTSSSFASAPSVMSVSAPVAAGGAPATASGLSVPARASTAAPTWAATDGMPAGYVVPPVPTAVVASAQTAQATATPPSGAAVVAMPASIESRTTPNASGPVAPTAVASAPIVAPSLSVAAAPPTLAAAAPIVPPDTTAAAVSSRTSAASSAARGPESRGVRTASGNARAAAKPTRRAPSARATPAVRTDAKSIAPRAAARQGRGDVFVN